MSSLYAALFSWAVSLSGLPAPADPPIVVAKPHSFFVDNACGGKECRVYGWYAGGREVYIDEKMNAETSLLAASVVVHEMVHYLQGAARNGGVPPGSVVRNGGIPARGAAFSEKPGCEAAIDMELEAYGVQREYLRRYGSIQPVGLSMARVSCK